MIPYIFLVQGCLTSWLYSAPKNDTFGLFSSNFLLFRAQSHIHQVNEVTVMFLVRGATDHYVIMDAYDSWALFHDEVHLLLKHVLGHSDGIHLNLYLC